MWHFLDIFGSFWATWDFWIGFVMGSEGDIDMYEYSFTVVLFEIQSKEYTVSNSISLDLSSFDTAGEKLW